MIKKHNTVLYWRVNDEEHRKFYLIKLERKKSIVWQITFGCCIDCVHELFMWVKCVFRCILLWTKIKKKRKIKFYNLFGNPSLSLKIGFSLFHLLNSNWTGHATKWWNLHNGSIVVVAFVVMWCLLKWTGGPIVKEAFSASLLKILVFGAMAYLLKKSSFFRDWSTILFWYNSIESLHSAAVSKRKLFGEVNYCVSMQTS